MVNMAVDKVRISVYLDATLKPKLEALARSQTRSLSNLIEHMCEEAAKKLEEEAKGKND